MTLSKSLVIVDLDNTLWDWVGIWHRSFSAMLERLAIDSGIPVTTLEADFKTVHEQHGTSEYSFAIEQLRCLREKHPGRNLEALYKDAIQAYRDARTSSLALYPTVLETLERLKDKGCLLVGYTESMLFYSEYRLRKLDLDRVLDFLYCSAEHGLRDGMTPEQIRKYSREHYELRRTQTREVAAGELKPNARVLLDIVAGVGGLASEAVYVGDSLMKDVAMANSGGLTAVWAKYGVADKRPEYELLRRVTHWSAEAVEAEKRATPGNTTPTFVLESSFSELLNHIEPTPFMDRTAESKARVVDMWGKTVDVQQHFNDLELRIRNYAVTLLVAVLGAIAFAIKEKLTVTVLGISTSLAAALSAAGIAGWLAFYFMDRFWYHSLLYGAVAHGRFIEARWIGEMPELGLTDAIGKASPLTIRRWKIRSSRKIDIFYFLGVLLLLILMISLHVDRARHQEPTSTKPATSLRQSESPDAMFVTSPNKPSPLPTR